MWRTIPYTAKVMLLNQCFLAVIATLWLYRTHMVHYVVQVIVINNMDPLLIVFYYYYSVILARIYAMLSIQ